MGGKNGTLRHSIFNNLKFEVKELLSNEALWADWFQYSEYEESKNNDIF